MFCTGGSVPYSARIEAKENLSSYLFCNTNLLDGRVQVLLSEKELSELPDNSLTFLRNLTWIAICKTQVQHSALENTVY